jgi:hypothetical protein
VTSPKNRPARFRAITSSPVFVHLVVFAAYTGAGIIVSWPRSTYMFQHELPNTRDSASYVWGFWWVARQVRHLANPWFTHYLAAPVGADLGFHALMPLEGVVMMPVTMAFGPSASYNLLSLLMPGLLCYAMYRVGRLWLPSQAGAIAAGAFFGLSSMMIWRTWYHLNIAVGVLFIPIALEAAVRLRRRPTWGQAVILGVILAASLLSDPEMFILVVIVTAATLLPYLVSGPPRARRSVQPVPVSPGGLVPPAGPAPHADPITPARPPTQPDHETQSGAPAQLSTPVPVATTSSAGPQAVTAPPAATAGPATAGPGTGRVSRAVWATAGPVVRRVWPLVLAGLVAVIVASPQLIAMVHQARTGGATSPAGTLATDYAVSGIGFPQMFGISPRVNDFGLQSLHPLTYQGPIHDGVQTFGLLVTVLAVGGLVARRRRRSAWLLLALWLGCVVLTLGANVKFNGHSYVPVAYVSHGVRLSAIMPYSWFVNLPGLQSFREAARISMLALVPAALLAGAAVNWLRYHAAPALVVVLVLAFLEAGWNGNPGIGTMPTALPRLDGPIAADRSSSLVLDVPFGLRGGVPIKGEGAAFDAEAQNLATADGHPRAVAFLSRLPEPVLAAIKKEPFYAGLLEAQMYPRALSRLLAHRRHGHWPSAQLIADRMNAHRMDIGWVIVWRRTPVILRYLKETGFVYAYQAYGVLVYRAAPWNSARELTAVATDRTLESVSGQPAAPSSRAG